VRKTSAALASLSLAVLALTGCTAAPAPAFDGATCDRASSTSGIDEAVNVEGEFGVAPDVHVFAPLHVEETSYTDVITGDGTALTSPQQIVSTDFAIYNGDTGEQIQRTAFDGDLSRVTNIATFEAQIPGLAAVLECATPGTRMLAAIAPEDAGTVFAGSGVDEDTTLVAVIDVLDTKLPRAEGSREFNDARNLPTVVRAPDGRPGIIVPGGDAPTEQVEQTLIRGDGETVASDDPGVWVNYTAVSWDDKTVVNTTWGSNPVADLSQIAPTVAEALVGETVGSQLLVVVPASETSSATAYVVDILGVSALPGQ
jgi:hypothetical protein